MRWSWTFTSFAFLTVAQLCSGGGMAAPPAEQNLAEFTNADGRAPDSKDDQTDDSEALRKAITAGSGPMITIRREP